MSQSAANHRRVQPSRWDRRAELSASELEREGYLPDIPNLWSPNGYYGFEEPNL